MGTQPGLWWSAAVPGEACGRFAVGGRLLERLGDGLADVGELGHLVRGDDVEDGSSYGVDVTRGGLLEEVGAFDGQCRELSASCDIVKVRSGATDNRASRL